MIPRACSVNGSHSARTITASLRGGDYINVWPFAVREDAEAFAAKFGGVLIDPKDRPKWSGRV